MEISETTAQTSQPAPAENTNETTAAPAWAMLLTGLAAMILIYLVTVFLPKIAAAVDKLLGREKKGIRPEAAETYKVYDIYEGEKNSEDENEDENSENIDKTP